MPNNKDNQKSNSRGSMGNTSNREFESQGQDPMSGKSGQQAGSTGEYGKKSGSHGSFEDDDMSTAGGREGQFSDSNRGEKGQWSPGSSQSSDE